jgi:NTP pyrophosphatase (non-canonical NTP hydrolase)
METAVKRFALTMQQKLDKNKYKECDEMNPDGTGRKWDKCSFEWLLYRLREETLELEKAIRCGYGREEIMDEAADVGNFAMMIHDNAIELNKPTEES